MGRDGRHPGLRARARPAAGDGHGGAGRGARPGRVDAGRADRPGHHAVAGPAPAHRGYEGSGGPRRAAQGSRCCHRGGHHRLPGRPRPSGGRGPAGRGLLGPDCAGARERPAVRRDTRAPGRERDAAGGGRDPLAAGAEPGGDAARGARSGACPRRRHVGDLLSRRRPASAPARGGVSRAEAPPVSLSRDPVPSLGVRRDRGRAWAHLDVGLPGGSAVRFPVHDGDRAGGSAVRSRPRSRGDGRGHLPRVVGPRPRLRPIGAPSPRGRGVSGGPRRRERGAGPADSREARRDGAAAQRQPGPVLDHRARPAPADPSGAGHADRRRRLGGGLARRSRQRRARAVRGVPRDARAGRAAPALPDRSRPEPPLHAGDRPARRRGVARRAQRRGASAGARRASLPTGPSSLRPSSQTSAWSARSSWSGGSAS